MDFRETCILGTSLTGYLLSFLRNPNIVGECDTLDNKLFGNRTRNCISIYILGTHFWTETHQCQLLFEQILLHLLTKLTSTFMIPDRRRAPKIISKEPIKNRNIASAIALYGTFGGLFLNCKVFSCWTKYKTFSFMKGFFNIKVNNC